MTFQTQDGVRYRMPIVFGPSSSPRQHPDGRMWTLEETGRMRAEWGAIRVRAQRDQLEALLPPGFSLRGEPTMVVNCAWFHDLFWLAGRGYGILSIEIATTYRGKTETIEGNFCPVLWEGEPDAIMTGREELGFPKMFAKFAPFALDEATGAASFAASWFDHTFFEAQFSDLVEVADPDKVMPGSGGFPSLFYKYMPRTAPFGKGGADVAYATTAAPQARPGENVATIPMDGVDFRKWTGSGAFKWNRATFQDNPLGFHVINGLAGIDVGEVLDVEFVKFSGPGIIISGAATMRAVEPA